MNSGSYAEAKTAFKELGDYKDSADLATKSVFVTLSEDDKKTILKKQQYISCGIFHSVGIKADGTVVATGKNDDGQCDVSGWKLKTE